MPTANPVVSPSQERADGHGWRVSPGWVMLRRRFCRGTTMLRAISPVPLPTPCTGAKLFSLSLLKAGGKDPQLLIAGVFFGMVLLFIGKFQPPAVFLELEVLSGGVEGSVAVRSCAPPRTFPLSALVGCYFFIFKAFFVFADLGRADPEVSPGDCSGFRRIRFQRQACE